MGFSSYVYVLTLSNTNIPKMRNFKRFVAVALSTVFSLYTHAQTFTVANNDVGIDHVHVTTNLMGGGTAFFDHNNDGHEDIYMTGGYFRDKLYENQGDGTFIDIGAQAGLQATDSFQTTGVITGDIDNDGFREIFICTEGWNGFQPTQKRMPNILLYNNGDGTYTDISQSSGILPDSAWTTGASFGDYNKDGYLDIYVSNYVKTFGFTYDTANVLDGFAHTGYGNWLYLNNGNNTFTNVTTAMGVGDQGCALATTFTDHDRDGDVDIYIANDFGEFVIPNTLYNNEYPSNAFTDVSDTTDADIGLYGMGIAIGDYDEDGDFDYYVTNLGRNVLLRNDGAKFVDVSTWAGVENTYVDTLLTTGWGTQFLDIDNDTYLDLFVSNGQIPAADFIATGPKDPHKLYRNDNASGTFSDISTSAGVNDSLIGRGSAYGDYDNDGDLDLMSVIVTDQIFYFPGSYSKLYKNENSSSNWVAMRLEGTISNKDAYGAQVELYTNGRMFIREVSGGCSHASQNSTQVHFGLGSYTTVDSIIIKWPSGMDETYRDLYANQHYYYVEGTSAYVWQYRSDSICTYASTASQVVLWDTLAGSTYDTINIVTYKTIPASLDTNALSICSGDSVLIYGNYQATEGAYYDTIQNGSICSIYRTNLSVVAPITTTLPTDTICFGDSVYYFGSWYSTITTASDTLTATNSCDSIVFANLYVRPVSIRILPAISICAGDQALIFGKAETTAAIYYDTLVSLTTGCDSFLSQQLFVLPYAVGTAMATICDGDSIYIGGAWQYTAGSYWDTLTSNNGCDSIITQELTVLAISSGITSVSICNGDSIYLANQWQYTAGSYWDTLTSSTGCDSLLETTLSLLPFTLGYDTLDLITGDSIYLAGEYQTVDGSYYDTLVANNGCDSIRITLLSFTTGIADRFENYWTVYPNPTKNEFHIRATTMELSGKLHLYDMSGKLILTKELTGKEGTVNVSQLAGGTYYIEMSRSASETFRKKIIVLP